MKVSLKTFLPFAATGLFVLSSCNDVRLRTQQYLNSAPSSALREMIDVDNPTLIQSRLDSMAYRDIFEGNIASKDSNLVAEFNKIASNTRGYNNDDDISAKKNKIENCLKEQGITHQELEDIKNKEHFAFGNLSKLNTFQHYADDWAYRKFFEKIGIMDEKMNAKCDSVSDVIRP